MYAGNNNDHNIDGGNDDDNDYNNNDDNVSNTDYNNVIRISQKGISILHTHTNVCIYYN